MKYLIKYYLLPVFFLSFFALEAKKEWVLVRPVVDQYERIEVIECVDTLNCYSFSHNVYNDRIHKTTDQGKTWTEIKTRKSSLDENFYNIISAKIYNDSNFYINYIDRLVLEVSEDGGETFRIVKFGKDSESENNFFQGLSIYTDSISAGIAYGRLIHTIDNWNTFEIVYLPDTIWAMDPIYYLDSNNIVIQRFDNGYETEFIKYNTLSRDFTIWSQGNKNNSFKRKLYELDFVNDSVGYASGFLSPDNDRTTAIVWKTTDRGRNWFTVFEKKMEPNNIIRDISFYNENNGIAITDDHVLETTDGGTSWFFHDIDNVEGGFYNPRVSRAGSVPFIIQYARGIYRLETVTEVEELSSDEKFRVYQSGRNLEIAINDPTQKQYSFELYSQTGQRLLYRSVGSAFGFIFQPVELIELSNGAYFYTISSNAGVEFSGKLVVAE